LLGGSGELAVDRDARRAERFSGEPTISRSSSRTWSASGWCS